MAEKIKDGKIDKEEIANEEAVSDVLEHMPDDVRESLMDLILKTESSEEFVRQLFVGDCPVCGSDKTSDCEELSIQACDVGVCMKCLTMWCLECGEVFKKGQTSCEHWVVVCDECELSKQEFGCGVRTMECEKILSWKEKKMDN